VQIRPVINAVEATLVSQATVASSDPAVEAAVSQLVTALGPALHVAAMEIAEQAAAEVRAQLPDHTVDVVLSDGDPALRVGETPRVTDSRQSEDLDARITLRLTPTLKQLIEDAAQTNGDSVNAWVVDALGKRARQRGRGKHYNESFDL
jgi:copper oxidase (laccase) domain-containing protein